MCRCEDFGRVHRRYRRTQAARMMLSSDVPTAGLPIVTSEQGDPMEKGRVYRHEIQVLRTSTSQVRFHAWVYDAAVNLLFDDDDFHSYDGSRTLANSTHTYQNVGNTSIFLIGLNGIGNNPSWPIHSSDQAAVAIVQGLPERQPIGAYGSVAGEVRR